MHRFHIRQEDWEDSGIRLSVEEAHHLFDVLRARPGDKVRLFDGRGREAVARVVAGAAGSPEDAAGVGHASERGRLELVAERVVERSRVAITLLQALPKGKRMDLIVEKATELGVARICPVVTRHVVVRLDAAQRAARRARWQRVAVSASKQSGRSWAPEITAVLDFDEALAVAAEASLFLVGALSAARPLHEVVGEAKRAEAPSSIALLIGPEGDLAPGERDEAQSGGAIPVSFGRVVLRVETAALYGVSVLAYEFLRDSAAEFPGAPSG